MVWVVIIMIVFVLGVFMLIVGFGFGVCEILWIRVGKLCGFVECFKLIMGVVFVMVGIVLFFNVYYVIDWWVISVLFIWF